MRQLSPATESPPKLRSCHSLAMEVLRRAGQQTTFRNGVKAMRFLWLVLIIAAVSAATATQTNPGIIEGRALNSVTQEPIANVQISLMAPATNPPSTGGATVQTSAVTDNEGRFRF